MARDIYRYRHTYMYAYKRVLQSFYSYKSRQRCKQSYRTDRQTDGRTRCNRTHNIELGNTHTHRLTLGTALLTVGTVGYVVVMGLAGSKGEQGEQLTPSVPFPQPLLLQLSPSCPTRTLSTHKPHLAHDTASSDGHSEGDKRSYSVVVKL